MNPAAFSRVADGQHGNMGRNALTTPGVKAWDFSMLKDFNFTEKHRLQFRFEAFNSRITPFWGNPTSTPTRPEQTSGPSPAPRYNMRQMQLAPLKYVF